jgi:unsaturated rhamnogalacturonyl hydrolase
MQHAMDYYVKDDGSIYDYKPEDFNIDHLNNGKILLTLYQVTGKEKYKKAIDQLHNQLMNHPRNSLGGFWHKKIYPNQMWLDGLYMGAAFYANWASVFHDTLAYNDITRQFVLAEKYTRDDKSGLLYHAWDESKQQKWSDPITGKSPHIWARAMGWYGMALVDALDYYPENHPGKDTLIQILQRWSSAILKVQDSKDGLWFDILDAPNDARNYKEASASSMFTLTLLKAIRKGYINQTYLNQAKKAYSGLLNNFISNDKGQLNLKGTVSVSGLGGNPYRDGSLDYYFNEPVVVNDPKGMGAFLQATVEAEFNQDKLRRSSDQKSPVVLLDAYYNNEIKKEQVIEAAQLIGVHDFILQLPGGYDYNVMERGATLSLGQRQLLSFVRALLYDPAILILDEATSSVDTESEQLIQQAIDKLITGRTSIIIAHRLSTIRKANKIIVLDKGEIREFGSHEELMKQKGLYFQLNQMQFEKQAID